MNGERSTPTSAVELAVDLHAVRVIATHNFQRCITALWKGYYHIKYYGGAHSRLLFAPYPNLMSPSFLAHFDPQRMKGVYALERPDCSPTLSECPQSRLHHLDPGFIYHHHQQDRSSHWHDSDRMDSLRLVNRLFL